MSDFMIDRKQMDHRDGIENTESHIFFDPYEKDQLFRAVIRRSLSGLFIFQKDRVVFSNPALQDILGLTEDEMLNINPFDLVYPADRDLGSVRFRSNLNRRDGCFPGTRWFSR